jgi:hypothetical protein
MTEARHRCPVVGVSDDEILEQRIGHHIRAWRLVFRSTNGIERALTGMFEQGVRRSFSLDRTQ